MTRCEHCGLVWLARHYPDNVYGKRRQYPAPALKSPPPIIDGNSIRVVGSSSTARAQPPRLPPPTAAYRAAAAAIDLGSTRPQRRPPRRRLTGFGIALGGLVLAALAVPVMTSIPGVAALFEREQGLAFRAISSSSVHRGGADTLIVQGELVNGGARTVSVPPIRISLRNEDSEEVYSWVVKPAADRLTAGSSIGFRSALANPAPGAKHVALSFLNTDGIAGDR